MTAGGGGGGGAGGGAGSGPSGDPVTGGGGSSARAGPASQTAMAMPAAARERIIDYGSGGNVPASVKGRLGLVGLSICMESVQALMISMWVIGFG